MGVDICLFVESDNTNCPTAFVECDCIRSVAPGEFFVWRNPDVYRILAGFRSARPGSDESPITLRGIPHPVSDKVYNRYYYIVDNAEYNSKEFDSELYRAWPRKPVPEQVAQQWVEEGLSRVAPPMDDSSWKDIKGEAPKRVSNPDAHYVNWLMADEFLDLIGIAEHLISPERPELLAIASLVRTLRDYLGSDRVRVVYWFDQEMLPD